MSYELPRTVVEAAEIVKALSSVQMRWMSEVDLQNQIGSVLADAQIAFQREVRLNDRDRPDFMIGCIALEVKIKGSAASVLAQLCRYAEHAEVEAVILVTTRRQHVVPTFIGTGMKPVYRVHLLSL